ncbi:hypothetical protein Tco_0361700, partial [Tanacetum coccineum]
EKIKDADVTSVFHDQEVLERINEDDKLLNQQKKKKGAVIKVTEWFIRGKSHIQDGSFDSPGYGMCELDRWDWRKRKKPSGTKYKFKRRKLRFDIWKWPLRKREGRTDVEGYLDQIERMR